MTYTGSCNALVAVSEDHDQCTSHLMSSSCHGLDSHIHSSDDRWHGSTFSIMTDHGKSECVAQSLYGIRHCELCVASPGNLVCQRVV